MAGPIQNLLQFWRRRWWRPDPAALAAFAGLKPMTVVTGGSEGIGFELARRFAAAGNDVMLVARRAEPLEQAAAQIRAEFKVEAVVLPARRHDARRGSDNRSGPGSARRLRRRARQQRRHRACPGRFTPIRRSDVLRLIDLNVRALTHLTRHFLPGMRVRGRGGILNVASLGGYAPGPNQAAYYASKAYVLSLTEAIAAETAGEGVRVCALAPGPVNTMFHARMGAENALLSPSRAARPRRSPLPGPAIAASCSGCA